MRETSEVQKQECLQNEVSELCKSLQHFYVETWKRGNVEIQGLTKMHGKRKRKNAGSFAILLQNEYTEIFSSSTWVYILRN